MLHECQSQIIIQTRDAELLSPFFLLFLIILLFCFAFFFLNIKVQSLIHSHHLLTVIMAFILRKISFYSWNLPHFRACHYFLILSVAVSMKSIKVKNFHPHIVWSLERTLLLVVSVFVISLSRCSYFYYAFGHLEGDCLHGSKTRVTNNI